MARLYWFAVLLCLIILAAAFTEVAPRTPAPGASSAVQAGAIPDEVPVRLVYANDRPARPSALTTHRSAETSSAEASTTASTPPDTPVLLSPATGTTGVTFPVTLAWQSVTGATSYDLQLDESTFGNPEINLNLTQTSYEVASQPSGSASYYYWRVRACNATGCSAWSAKWTFTTEATAPAPVLTAPSDGAIDLSTTPQLVWQAVPGAGIYQLEVAHSAGFGADIVHLVWPTDTNYAVPVGVLALDSTYYWRVKVPGSYPYSQVYSFTTGELTPPVLSSPSNGSTGHDPNTLTLQWNTASGATDYQLQVSKKQHNFSGNKIVVDAWTGGATSYTVPNSILDDDSHYYWRVKATDGTTTTDWSEIWSLGTGGVPAAPVRTAPLDEATGVALEHTFAWQAASGATDYEIHIATDINDFANTMVVDALTGGALSYVPGQGVLSAQADYYWRVRGINASGNGPLSSPIWHFTTGTLLPDVPSLTVPADNAQNVPVPVLFTWQTATGATTYDLEVATDTAFTGLAVDTTGLSDSTYTATTLAHETTYYWHVRGVNAGGAGAWSARWQFSTAAVPPDSTLPQLVDPLNTATNQPISLDLVWNEPLQPQPNGYTYRVQLSQDPNFVSSLVTATTTDTTYAAGSLLFDQLYYWRVKSYWNESGGQDTQTDSSAWTSPWQFTTMEPPVPAHLSPADDSTGLVNPITLAWSATAGATAYEVELDQGSIFSEPADMANTLNAPETSWEVGSLTPGAVYCFGTLVKATCFSTRLAVHEFVSSVHEAATGQP